MFYDVFCVFTCHTECSRVKKNKTQKTSRDWQYLENGNMSQFVECIKYGISDGIVLLGDYCPFPNFVHFYNGGMFFSDKWGHRYNAKMRTDIVQNTS